MFRYQIKIEYDGTDFVGWQYQKNGVSIQEALQNIFLKLLKEKIVINGSGRTDAGVHALEQSAHIETKKEILDKIRFINTANFYLKKFPISLFAFVILFNFSN